MRQRQRYHGTSTLLKLAGATLIASLSGACSSDMMRFSEPFSNPFASGQADPASTGSINRSPVSKVQTSSLAAPRSQPLPGSAPRVASTGNTPVTGSVNGWTASGGTPVTLGAGDTVEALSGRYGVPVAALRTVNGLSGNSQPSAGQQFIIPAFNPGGGAAKVAQASSSFQEAKAAPARMQETVKAGSKASALETDEDDSEPQKVIPKAPAATGFKPLDKRSTAAAQQVEHANSAVAKANDAKSRLAATAPAKSTPFKSTPAPKKAADEDDDDEPVKTAEPAKAAPLRAVVAKTDVKKVEPVKVEAKKVEAKTAAEVRKAEPVRQIEIKQPAAPVKTSKLEKDPETTGSVAEPKDSQEFRWPARGRVIQGYGSKGASGTNDGINIAVPEGTPVKATEGGTVAYAGEEIKGYGKMVLIRHPNGYTSAYAHNGDLNVKRGDAVKRGQVIAKSGQSGNVTSPQLHFELRKGAEPVDPSKFLEGN